MTSMADRRPTCQWDKGDPDLELQVTGVDHMSLAKVENIYHVTTQKATNQWDKCPKFLILITWVTYYLGNNIRSLGTILELKQEHKSSLIYIIQQ